MWAVRVAGADIDGAVTRRTKTDFWLSDTGTELSPESDVATRNNRDFFKDE
jgi:hypothetical protein